MPTAAIDVGLPSWKHLPGEKRLGLGLLCPHCAGDTGVIDSRSGNNNTVRRRRCCFACQKRFTTWEIVAARNPATNAQALRQQAKALRAMAEQFEALAAAYDPDPQARQEAA